MAYVRILSLFLAAVLSSFGTAHAGVLPRPTPIVITLDGHDYITYVSPLELTLAERMLLAPESSMQNCRREGGAAFPPGHFRLLHTPAGDEVDSIAMRIEFNPTRVVLDTEFGDVLCDGEASAHVTGVGRVFEDEFELDDPALR